MNQRRGSFLAALAGAAIAGCVLGGYGAMAAPNANAVFAKAKKTALAAKSLKATLRVTITENKQSGTLSGPIELMKPNYGHIKLSGTGVMAKAGVQQFVSTGKKVFLVSNKEKKYLSVPAERKGENLFLMVGRILTPVVGFTDPDFLRAEGAVQSVTAVKVNNKPYQKVVVLAESSPSKRVLFFGGGGLLEGIEYTQAGQGGSVTFRVWLENITLNPQLTAKRFAYSPPAGFTLSQTKSSDEPEMLALGAKAPDFSLPGAFGGKYTLKELMKGKKATLVSFWFLNCGPCRMELPHIAKLYPGWKKRGLGMVAINADDQAKEVQQYIYQEKLNYPVALAVTTREGLLRRYKVEAFPTAYLLDRNGKIVWRRAGFDPEGLDAAIEEALSK